MSHTPGPWTLEVSFPCFRQIHPKPEQDGGGIDIYGPGRKGIALTTFLESEREEKVANAMLIATSPEMYAALEHAENEMLKLKASLKQLAPIRAALKAARAK